MLSIINSCNLKNYNTFGLEVTAEHVVHIQTEEDLKEVFQLGLTPLRILGGGSNILLTKDIKGYLLKCEIKGYQTVFEDSSVLHVEVGAGETWHDFVLWAIQKNVGGIENLSLIPGTVGAAPIQNIGAYGVEQKEVFLSLKAFNLESGFMEVFSNQACQFGYRDSFFKREGKGKYFITSVTYALSKTNHRYHIAYGDIKKKLEARSVQQITLKDISDCIIDIRTSKLPDPKKIGNAGSFFKNPVIEMDVFQEILKSYPDIPYFPGNNSHEVKIPAGWLIEKLGYKGYDKDGIGVHDQQALVLVNRNNGNGASIFTLAKEIQKHVEAAFGINLEMEVNIW